MHRAIRSCPPFRVWTVWAVAAAILAAVTALVLAGRPSGASTAFPTQCATSSSPYGGASVATVFAQHGIVVHRYSKAGLSLMLVASASTSSAMPGPIFGGTVNTRSGMVRKIAGSAALVGVNGDFFAINGNSLPYGVEVGPGGKVFKATAHWADAAITTTGKRVVAGLVRADIVLYHATTKWLASTLNDPRLPTGGTAVFNSRWGTGRVPVPSHGPWREWIVNSRGLVVATHVAATRPRVPAGGFVVEASGSAAVHLQMNGWRGGAHVHLGAYAKSSVPGGVYAAEGSGGRLIHGGAADRSSCGYDAATTRTVVGMAGSKTFLLTMGRGRGVTTRELIAILRSFGVTEAVTFDGGGSTGMATRTRLLTAPLYGIERSIPGAWGLVPR